jgi:hypothetical protein
LRQSAATDPLLSFKHYQAVVRELAATWSAPLRVDR